MDILSWNDDPDKGVVLGPFSSVEKSANEIRVPIDLGTMDDEAERFFCEAQLMGEPLDNLLAVRQKGGTWELREFAGRWALVDDLRTLPPGQIAAGIPHIRELSLLLADKPGT